MTSPFFSGVDEAAAMVVEAPRVLVGFNVDDMFPGARRSEGLITQAFRHDLEELRERPRTTVVVLSARNRDELQTAVKVAGLVYVGNLGMEISGDGFLFVEPTAAGYADELSGLGVKLAAKLASVPGVRVENKGLIIRILATAAEESAQEEVRHLIHETLANVNHPFHLTSRGLVYEIRPRVSWTKANALAWVNEHLGQPQAQVIYVSADGKDEETIAALPSAITIKVGRGDTTARYRLDKPEDMGALVKWLKDVLLVPSPTFAARRQHG